MTEVTDGYNSTDFGHAKQPGSIGSAKCPNYSNYKARELYGMLWQQQLYFSWCCPLALDGRYDRYLSLHVLVDTK